MRAAPAVTVRGSGGLRWRLAQTLLPALAAGVLAAWWLLRSERDAVPAWGAAAGVAALAWRQARPRSVEIAWDGQRWTAGGTAGRLSVMIDLGSWLLLRLEPGKRQPPVWVAVTAAEAHSSWHALRAAVYSRPPQAAPRVHPAGRAAD